MELDIVLYSEIIFFKKESKEFSKFFGKNNFFKFSLKASVT